MRAPGIALIAALFSSAAAPAVAVVQCGPAEQVLTQLLEEYGEVPVGYGFSDGFVTQVMVSKEGTWTAIVVGPDGQACIVAAGTDWTFVEMPWPAEGIDG